MVVDGGGRGQALAVKLAPECDDLFVSPGNPGNECIAFSTGISTTDIDGQLQFAARNKIDLTVVGEEDPLERGIVNHFQEARKAIFGPTSDQARIESDRYYSKLLAEYLKVPIGHYDTFTNKEMARIYAQRRSWPLFVKSRKLARGKGSTTCRSMSEFKQAIGRLPDFIVEDEVPGPEASHLTFGDGQNALPIPFLIRDHKYLNDGDSGPMTGGMGAFGPLPGYTPEDVEELGKKYAEPLVRHLGYKGVVFSGLKGEKGKEKNLEWNARLGDPETQVMLRLMKSPLLPLIMACVEGKLDELPAPEWALDQAVVCLVLAARGYPGRPEKGGVIEGIEQAAESEEVDILHAGTTLRAKKLVADGGRVLNIVAIDKNLPAALAKAQRAARYITINGLKSVFRTDIGRTA